MRHKYGFKLLFSVVCVNRVCGIGYATEGCLLTKLNIMRTTKVNVLIVEDCSAELLLFKLALKDSRLVHFISLIVARNGSEAIDLLIQKERDKECIDLMLMNINLPMLSGTDVLRKVRSQNMPSLQVFIISNSGYDSDISDCYELGANAYIQKPIDYDQLVDFCSVIKHCIQTHGLVDIALMEEELGVGLMKAGHYRY